MKPILIASTLLAASILAQASLKPGDKLTAYEIKNVKTGQQYCQVCKYGTKTAKIISFGKLKDEAFWADLKKLQELHSNYKNLGVFAQVIDSKDTEAIKAAAEKHGIEFPVVVAVEKDWDQAYKVDGVSRTIYYARGNKISWVNVGLDDHATAQLQAAVKKDLAG